MKSIQHVSAFPLLPGSITTAFPLSFPLFTCILSDIDVAVACAVAARRPYASAAHVEYSNRNPLVAPTARPPPLPLRQDEPEA